MKKLCFWLLTCTLSYFPSCKHSAVNSVPNYLNKDVYPVSEDVLTLTGDKDFLFSNNLSIVSKQDSIYIIFDGTTKHILAVNSSKAGKDGIVEYINLADRFEKYPGFVQNMMGVKEIGDHQFLLISFPFSIIVDSDFNFTKRISFKSESDDLLYNPSGSVHEICFNENNHCIYYPMFPDLPASHKDYFDKGRIVEVNLKSEKVRVLPIGLPSDYEPGKNYGIFSLPLITARDNSLYYIYVGSNILYKLDLNTQKTESITLATKHANISAVELTGNIFDQIYKHAECATFYRAIGNEDLIMLFYRDGSKKGAFNIGEGISSLNQYVMAYSPKSNEVLYDIPLNIEGTYNDPSFNENGILYFLKDGNMVDIMEIRASFLKYRFMIQ